MTANLDGVVLQSELGGVEKFVVVGGLVGVRFVPVKGLRGLCVWAGAPGM